MSRPRKVITLPRFRERQTTILMQASAIQRNAERLAKLAGPREFTFLWNQITNYLRARGHHLPGDGKGGLIVPKPETEN